MDNKEVFEVTFTNGDKVRYTVDNLLNELSGEGRLADSVKIIDCEDAPEQPKIK